ncbi:MULTISPECIES: sulfur carrier protein ThiS [Gulbenkiania]|uniref:Thiamine biosynthesis protein ThiS n=1 Tax=Gulbenkiania indica TaxID=375574 RepID=A0A0K6GSY3_9NEIS|nr:MULTISPECIES: sulfur carrier protein ThiS [Gulbenkiania]CUA81643.1 thiamine biosynthesis protein ThiS [Gulbenkiania indica]
MNSLEILLNGAPRTFPQGCSVAAMVEALGLAGRRVAVERNGTIVPRSRHAETALAEGDRIEIVVAVGGG